MERTKSIIDLSESLNSRIRITIHDREIIGTLKAFDKIPNLVLDDAIEVSMGDRLLGVVIVRGQMITSILPELLTPTENPFT